MKKPIIFLSLIFLFTFLIFPFSGNTKAYAAPSLADEQDQPKISAKSALLLDYSTDQVVYSKNADEKLPIASMTKLASLSLVLDSIDKGAVKENDMVVVSETAAAVGGSSAFLDAGSSYKLTDLVKSVIIASANDSCVALAEHIAGSEDVFVSRMNKFANGLGLKNTNFKNATGLPEKDHYSTAHDMAKIYKTVCNHRLYKKYSKIWMEDFIHPSGRKTGLVNTNRLIRTFEGIEGGKTGYTDAAKFCLTASASRGTTRLIAVVIGAGDSKTRFNEVSSLLNFGFANFESKLIVNSELPVTVTTPSRSKTQVEVYPSRDSVKFESKHEDSSFSTDIKLNDIKAPLKAGDVVGKEFVFDKNNMVIDEIDLIVKKDVPALKLKDTLYDIISNW